VPGLTLKRQNRYLLTGKGLSSLTKRSKVDRLSRGVTYLFPGILGQMIKVTPVCAVIHAAVARLSAAMP